MAFYFEQKSISVEEKYFSEGLKLLFVTFTWNSHYLIIEQSGLLLLERVLLYHMKRVLATQ